MSGPDRGERSKEFECNLLVCVGRSYYDGKAGGGEGKNGSRLGTGGCPPSNGPRFLVGLVYSSLFYLFWAGSPGGSDTDLQFNSGSTFSGSAKISYDYTLGLLSYKQIGVRRIPSESKTTNFTAGYEMIYPVDSTGSAITASLPGIDPAGTSLVGMTYTIKDVGGSGSTNNIRIQPSGSEKIDGASAAKIATDYGSMILTAFSGAAGGEWMIIGTN